MNGRLTPGCRPALAHTAVLALLLLAAAPCPAGSPDDSARARIAELRTEIAHHDDLYFRHATPEISDGTYDALRRELAALEREHPADAMSVPPLPSLGDDHREGFARVPHGAPMLGLEKCHTETELKAWYGKVGDGATLVIEPKVDGLAVSATYEHGRLIRVLTRGNGLAGDDVTAVARSIRSLPPGLAGDNLPGRIELRGEVYVSWAEFAKLNRERAANGEEPFAHPRNFAAGTLQRLVPDENAERLDVVFYAWGACEPAALAPKSQRDFHELARRWRLPVIAAGEVASDGDALRRAVREVESRRRSLAFPIDGAVAKIDAVAWRNRLGESAAAPRWAIAYKFAAERADTRLRAITIQVGRSGRLTPVAEFDPVELGGATITRATLHNPATIGRLDLRIGDLVTVEKAGEIIPQLVARDPARRVAGSTEYRFPRTCPECGTPTELSAEHTEARCPNHYCAAQVRGRIEHYVANVEIKGLGPATIASLVNAGLVRDPSDLYTLRHEQLVKLPRVGRKTAKALLESIDRSRHAEQWRVIAGLGIPRVGKASAKLLAARYRTLATMEQTPKSELAALVGEATARELATWFTEPRNRELCARLAVVRGERE